MHLIKSCACGSNAPIGQVENYTLCPKQELAGDECGFVDEVVLFVGLQLLYALVHESKYFVFVSEVENVVHVYHLVMKSVVMHHAHATMHVVAVIFFDKYNIFQQEIGPKIGECSVELHAVMCSSVAKH